MTDSFYIPDGEGRFISTDWTIGPWSRESQHAGPPAALLGRAVDRVVGRDDMQVVRATYEILRPIPVAPLKVEASVLRPGRSVVLSEASLTDEKGVVMNVRAWSIRVADVDLAPEVHGDAPPDGPGAGSAAETFVSGDANYLQAMDWRFVRGAFLEPGPATAWARMRVSLVEGEEIAPLSRVLVLADSGNGISSNLDFTEWLFINPDLTVYLHRLPEGEWVCLDAQTTIEASGIGFAASVLSDARGVIGRGAQSLLIAPRR